jgi:DNA-directed RNA polymerase subunit D
MYTCNSKNGDTLNFTLNVNQPTANAIRRFIISSVKTYAIDIVEISMNTTCLTDEFIAHRLGLIPLIADGIIEDCEFTLNVPCIEGPLGPKSTRVIYSKDLISNNDKIKPISDNFPILKLSNTQQIFIKAYIKKSSGSEHIKWSPATICTFSENKPNSFNFELESTGTMTPENILKEATLELIEMLNTNLTITS